MMIPHKLRRDHEGAALPGTQSSRLAEFGGRGMSFNICRRTLGSLAMSAPISRASSFGGLYFPLACFRASFWSPRHQFDCGGDN
jgi:hypothetical protein